MKTQQIVDRHLCSGCGACAYVDGQQLVMIDTVAHGKRPVVTTDEVSNTSAAGIQPTPPIEAYCPGATVRRPSRLPNDPGYLEELRDDWGPVLEVWEGYASDEEIRFRGSSGGVVTALALYCIEQEEMSGALHVRAESGAPLVNKTVLSRSRAELLAGAGSRYAPASPCERLGLIESQTSPAVFIGKPCDVAGANQVAAERPRLANRLGLTMAIFCAGTPSMAGTEALARSLGVDSPRQITGLRYRGEGWPGNMRVEYIAKDGKPAAREVSYASGWGEILQKYRQWRCHMCADHTGESADLSIGDPWYRPIEPGEAGRSLILVRTERGRRIVRQAMQSGYVKLERRESHVVAASQRHLQRVQSAFWGRALACRLMGLRAPRFPGKPLFKLWWRNLTWKEKVQSVVGTMKRICKKRLGKAELALPQHVENAILESRHEEGIGCAAS